MKEEDILLQQLNTRGDEIQAHARDWMRNELKDNPLAVQQLVNVLMTEPPTFRRAIAALPDEWLQIICNLAMTGLSCASISAFEFIVDEDNNHE